MIHRAFRIRFHDPRNETIWLTVYADMVTNLTLIFLALFGLTIMGGGAIQKAVLQMKLGDFQGFDETFDMSEFQGVVLELREEFKFIEDIDISEEAGIARLTLGENVLFPSGGAALKEQARPVLAKVARFLKKVPFTVVVEGHTDSTPLKSGLAYANNWELSLARAMSVVRVLVEKEGFEPRRLAAAAYGPYRPRASNGTAVGRRLNRRVEISILKDFPMKIEEKEEVKILSSHVTAALGFGQG